MRRSHQSYSRNGKLTETEGESGSKQHAEKYRQWQEFKNQQRNQEHRLLQKKVLLQHELIEANDRLHQQLLDEDEQRKIQLREAIKKEKAMKQQNLMDTGNQSLANEKQKQSVEQPKQEIPNQSSSAITYPRRRSGQYLSKSESQEHMKMDTKHQDHHHMDVDEGTIKEEDEDDDEDFEEKEDHEYELQKMFGKRQANYFLRPRIEPEKKKQTNIPPAVRRKGGRAGATMLWKILRDNTSRKLQKADSQIPDELKDAYGAFVRECLTKNEMVAQRSFYSGNGVPETEKLQDGSYRDKVRELRHNVELMYRSAHNNQDKTAILTYNNPLPDFSDRNGEEGPMRYYPSWIANEEDAVDVPAYHKWLTNKEVTPAEDELHDSREPTPGRTNSKHLTSKKTAKLSFLTEADATCDGQFWASKQNNPPENPEENEIILLSKRRSMLREKSTTEKRPPKEKQKRRSLTAPSLRLAKGRVSEPWEPLSLAALTEYKPTLDTFEGPEGFSHGSTNMWKPVLANESL
ncbi:uncharacterized protein [Antedon mediterranea]|uniref:uncharacterized protein isoform X2 n=1 Tax=Antedon mediterranea TaxID=105859 RepID=UPI003AF8B8FE